MSWAYEFRSPKAVEELESALNQAGPWSWQLRDSHWYGDYLNVRPVEKLRVRIHEDGAGMLDWWAAQQQGRAEPESGDRRRRGEHRYRVQIDMDNGCEIDRTRVDNVLLSLLGAAEARDFHEIESYD